MELVGQKLNDLATGRYGMQGGGTIVEHQQGFLAGGGGGLELECKL